MAIKTDELQQLASALGTDSVLLDTGSAGTARLSLANLAKFLTEQDNAVKTALSNKAALSAQETVEAVSVSTEEITLEASELPGFIAALPRLLTTHYILHVSGTLNEYLNIVRFYGSGRLRIVSDTPGGCVFQKPVTVAECGVDVQFWDVRFQQTEELGANDSMLMASSYVRVANSEFAGLGQQTGRGAQAEYDAALLLEHCKIHGFNVALFVGRCSRAVVLGGGETDFYDNNNGVYAWMGGEAYLYAPSLLGGSTNLKQGGIIVNSNGTLL